MAKKKYILVSLLKISLLILCLISFSSEQIDWIYYNYDEQYVEKDITNSEKERVIALDLTQTGSRPLDNYIKVTVTPRDNHPTPVVIFSPSPSIDNRQVISRVGDGSPAKLYLKKEQFVGGDDDLYLRVICEKDGCDYHIRFDGAQSAEIDTNTTYSYLITENNRDMRFDVFGETSGPTFLTVSIEGSSSTQLSIEGIDKKPYEFENGKILTFPLPEDNSSILASIFIKSGTVGDYITLNVHTVKDNTAPDNLLYPNGPVITGILEKNENTNLIEECFPMSIMATEKYKTVNTFYLTGKIHSKYALFWLGDENHQFMEETELEIKDGLLSFLIQSNGKMRYVCFEFSDEEDIKMETVAYSISISEPTTLDEIHNFYAPQLMGRTYRRMVPKGKYAVYHAGKINESDKKITYNIYNRKGVAEMYFTSCNSYPLCFISNEDLDLKTLKKPKNINKMTIWEVKNDGKSVEALDREKDVMVIYCKDDDNENNGYCEFESLIYTERNDISLVEEEKFSKYVVKEDKGRFKIDLKRAQKLQSLTIDIMIFSGDVSFDVQNPVTNGNKLEEDIEYTHYKYFLSNKIFYHFNLLKTAIDSITISYSAELNSFFTIQYGIDAKDLEQKQEVIRSGESYLVEIDPTSSTKAKTIYLENYRYKKNKPFLSNFFALNCEFHVLRDLEEISFFDGYAQEVLFSDTKGYKAEKYEYKVIMTEAELSNYNHKMCMLYIAGYESRDDDTQTEIVIGENINQQVIFDNNFNEVRFLFPQGDPEKDIALYINIIDQAYYRVCVYINNEEYQIREYIVTRSQIFYLEGTEISNYCEKDTLCNIIINAEFTEQLGSISKPDYMIEITLRNIKNTPTYLQKGQAKKDFTCGDYLYYYYMDLGKNDVGEISVNFLRDFGNLWGKVVRKDQSSIDEEANWRGKYRMPSKDWDDHLVNQYTKKLEITSDETQDCIEGCYLLLSIQISQIGPYAPASKFYPFSIITSITQNNAPYTDIPKIIIQVNEFIVGNIEISENERISQFYEIYLPHDSIYVEFDFQSEVAGLYINVGGIRPTTKNADFTLKPQGRDTLFRLEKMNIYQKAKEKRVKIPIENSIQDLNLVIGVWTDKTDSINSELFSLRVNQPNIKDDIDIIEVNTDQKILCHPTLLNDDQYRCLFMVTYDDEDVNQELPLIIHSESFNLGAETNIYGSLIEREFYDKYEIEDLKSKIPTSQTAQYSTLESNTNYLYIKLVPGRFKYYFFVNVISNKEDDIMILTTIPVYNILNDDVYEFFPNPSTEQLLSVSIDKLILNFPSPSIIAHFVTLDGEADISWENGDNKVYNLKGRGDRLSLTSGIESSKIIVNRKKKLRTKLSDEENDSFIFYISYYERNAENNFDQVPYGRPVELAYRDTNLPVYLYSKIGNDSDYNDIHLSVTFKDSDIDVEGVYNNSPLNVLATLAKQNTVYKSKLSPELGPNLGKFILGYYDPSIRTAHVFFDSSTIKNFNIKPEDNPTLYLSIEQNKEVDTKDYSNFNVEAQFTKVNSEIVPVENIFNYGRLGSRYNYYKLRVNKKKQNMIIEVALNSPYTDFTINENKLMSNNSELIVSAVKETGKVIVKVNYPETIQFLYLYIFKKRDNTNEIQALYNYVFRYLNVEKEDEFKKYTIFNGKSEISYEESKTENGDFTIKCTFNRLNISYDKANITYFFKVVENKSLIYGESCETIAFTQSPYYTVYKRNPSYDNDGKITLTATGKLSNWACLQIIAQIQQDTILEYVSYKGKEFIRPPEEEETPSSNYMALIVVMIILIVLVIGLALLVFIIQQKNKGLSEQVKHISFQQSQNANQAPNADPSLLLKK